MPPIPGSSIKIIFDREEKRKKRNFNIHAQRTYTALRSAIPTLAFWWTAKIFPGADFSLRLFLASLQVLIGIDTLIILVPPERNQSTLACCAWFQLNVVNYSVLHLQLTVLLKVGLSATGLHTYAINVHNHAAHSSRIHLNELRLTVTPSQLLIVIVNGSLIFSSQPPPPPPPTPPAGRRHRLLPPCVNKNFFFPFSFRWRRTVFRAAATVKFVFIHRTLLFIQPIFSIRFNAHAWKL